jgi:hypothetical protein
MKRLLHVGCGPTTKTYLPEYFHGDEWREVRFDIDPQYKPDIIGTTTNMSAVATGSMAALYSSHNIEHLFPHEVPVALGEFRRVLSDDGFAVVTCPDLQSVCRLVADGNLTGPVYTTPRGPVAPIDMLYGFRPETRSGNQFWAHKCGFIRSSLISALSEVGFAVVATGIRGFELWAIARKSPASDADMRQLALAVFGPKDRSDPIG